VIWFAVGLACALPIGALFGSYLTHRQVDRIIVALGVVSAALRAQARAAELLQQRRLEEEREGRAVRASRAQRQPVGFRVP
jgi:predicted MFS family arabinose efflux permease